ALKKPSDARRRKYKVWGEDYDRIFGGQIIESHILPTLIYMRTGAWLQASGLTKDPDDTKRKLANNASFHIARIVAYLWRGSDNWNVSPSTLVTEINQVEDNSEVLDRFVSEAFELLAGI